MSESSQNTSFDAGRRHLGTVYAKGLLGAAQNRGVLSEVVEQLDSLIDDVLAQLPKFRMLLASPRVDPDAKLALLDRAFAGKMTPVLLTFLKVVARHGRLDCLPEIRIAARAMLNELTGRVEVQVRTAGPVGDSVMNQILQKLTTVLGRRVDLKSEVDPDLLGGVVVRVGDTVFDGSLEYQLQRMRTEALEGAAQEIRDALHRFVTSDQSE